MPRASNRPPPSTDLAEIKRFPRATLLPDKPTARSLITVPISVVAALAHGRRSSPRNSLPNAHRFWRMTARHTPACPKIRSTRASRSDPPRGPP
ncbi:t15 [Tupaiid betaherpesvirus 1]|uniref:T15 n=1 Tax=Tupaiid herpesvirus 1 (strain 1) TaxID=10397 RepID=Q91TU7_TUHV1|nr:t15 [Tupaiid betaherpesvirus 1]AAK57040.1 t15 [Tupaiid betaherpesvirus 1]